MITDKVVYHLRCGHRQLASYYEGEQHALSRLFCNNCGGPEFINWEKTLAPIKARQFNRKEKQKPRWDLMPWEELTEVAKVLTFGAAKYSDNGWKEVESPHERYKAAAQRHLVAYYTGEAKDEESSLHPLAHAIADLLFLMWYDGQKEKRNDNS